MHLSFDSIYQALYQTLTRPLHLSVYSYKIPATAPNLVSAHSYLFLSLYNFLTFNLNSTPTCCHLMNAMLWVGLATPSLLHYMETWYHISGVSVNLFIIYPFQDSLMETCWCNYDMLFFFFTSVNDTRSLLGISHLSWPWWNVIDTVPGAKEIGTWQAPCLV